MKVVKEEPLLLTAVNVTTNPEVMAKPNMQGTTITSFPVTTYLRADGKQLIVDGTLISKGVLDDENTLMYSASCTGRIVYYFDEAMVNYEEKEVYDQFIRPVYCVLSERLHQLIMSIGLVVTFPLAIPPSTTDVHHINMEKTQ